MSKIVTLLPERVQKRTSDGTLVGSEAGWPPGTNGFARLEAQTISGLLVREDLIDPRGVSDPWSAAVAFEWRLQRADPLALRLLEALLLANHLGVVRFEERRLDGRTLLERVLRTALAAKKRLAKLAQAPHPVSLQVGLLAASASSEPSNVVAGGIHPDWTVFPAARLQSQDGLRTLRTVLLATRKVETVGDEWLQLRDASQEARFRGLLRALADHDKVVTARSPWYTALVETLSHVSQPVSYPASTILLPRALDAAEWVCSAHGALPWAEDSNVSTVIDGQGDLTVRCGSHNVALTKGNRAVSLEDLGAAVMRRPDGRSELVVWEDAEARDPALELRSNVPASGSELGSVLFAYLGRPKITLRGRSYRLADVLCASAPTPHWHSGKAALPIRREFLDLVDLSIGEQPRWLADESWEVRLRGRGERSRLPVRVTGDAGPDSGLVVWPGRIGGGWFVQVFGVIHRYLDDVSVVERLPEGSSSFGPWKSLPLLDVSERGRLAFLSFRRDNEELGAVVVPQVSSLGSAATGRGRLAIDLGTSNTVVAYQVADDPGTRFVEHGRRDPKDCNPATKAGDFGASLANSLRVFTEWHVTPTPKPILASLVVERRDPVERKDQQREPIQYSAVPREPSLVQSLKEDDRTAVHHDLKWRATNQLKPDVVKAFLERILLPACFQLRDQTVGRIAVAATYPLAFDAQRKKIYEEWLKEVLAMTARKTGLDFAEPRWYSESHAGVDRAPGPPAMYKLTVDVGGGTTDLAVLTADRVLAADSLKVGARKLIRAIMAVTRDFDDKLARSLGLATGHGLPIELLFETIVQARGIDGLVAAIGTPSALGLRRSVAAWIAAITYASHQLLEASLPAAVEGQLPQVNVALLGQGWSLITRRFLPGFSEERFLYALGVLGRGRYRLETLRGDSDPVARKCSIAQGALSLLAKDRPSIDMQDEPRFVGMELASAGGGTISASERLRSLDGVTLQTQGDYGFGRVIDALGPMMTACCEESVGDVTALLLERRPELIAKGCHDLEQHCLDAQTGEFRRSPLLSFLEGPWLEAWGTH